MRFAVPPAIGISEPRMANIEIFGLIKKLDYVG
jgi:hypothetical protein